MTHCNLDTGRSCGARGAPPAERLPAARWAARAGLVLFLLFLPLTGRGAEGTLGDPGLDWRDGPVRYLLTHDEYDRYGRLRTAEARGAFVARFWRRLDPDPDTPENSYKERFDRLRVQADQRFGNSVVAGWRTDRGQVLMLLGEPDSVRRLAGDPVSVMREIWTYNRRPGGRAEPLEIVFYGDRSGQFRLQPPPGAETEQFRDPVELVREFQRVRSQQRNAMIALPRDLTELYEQLHPFDYATATRYRANPGRPRQLDQGSGSRFGSATEAAEGPASPIASDAAYFFQSADGGTMAVLALEYRSDPSSGDSGDRQGSPEVEPKVSAWILDADDRLAGRSPAEVVVRLERRPTLERAGSMMFTGRAYLEPGTYEARYTVEDRPHKLLAIRNVTLAVPDIPLGELGASTVVPALRFGPVQDGHATPFAVGSEEVVPKPGASFRRGEPLRIYFQVYGAARDPAIRRPRVDVTFRFQWAGARRFRQQGEPVTVRGAAGESMGLTLPVKDWPAGDYRVEIDLVDRVSGARTSTGGSFRIAD